MGLILVDTAINMTVSVFLIYAPLLCFSGRVLAVMAANQD